MSTNEPVILHIELGNRSLNGWIRDNKYVIFSELVRYCEKLIIENLDEVQAIMISNLSDNIVFIIKKDSVSLTLEKAMEYFLGIEEYDQCAKIRDLEYLLKTKKDEPKDIKISRPNKRKSKRD